MNVTKEQIVQLREHDLNRGHDKSNKPVYPRTVAAAIEGIEELGGGVTKVATLPNRGELGKIYYNTTDNKYYVFGSDGWEPAGKDAPIPVVTDPNEVEHRFNQVPDSVNNNAGTVEYLYDLQPNVFYNIEDWLEVDNLPTVEWEVVNIGFYFVFDPNTDGAVAGRFKAWEDGINFHWPAGVKVANSEDVEIVNGHTYEFNVYKGVAIIMDLGELDLDEENVTGQDEEQG